MSSRNLNLWSPSGLVFPVFPVRHSGSKCFGANLNPGLKSKNKSVTNLQSLNHCERPMHFLKSNNVHVNTPAKFMGHSNPLVTLKICTLVKDDEINLVGEELRRALVLGSNH